MAAPHETRVSIDYPFPEEAGIVERSVAREMGEIDGDRSRTAVSRDGATLSIVVEADDLVALRAATNTWLSLVDVAERVAALGRPDG